MYDHSANHMYSSNWHSSMSPTSPWSANMAQLQNYNNSIMHSSSRTSLHESPVKSNSKWNTIIKQKIQELENSNFQYKPLFNAPPTPEVILLDVYLIYS